MKFQKNKEAEEKQYPYTPTYSCVGFDLVVWFGFVFNDCMVLWSNLFYHSAGRKPEGKAISLPSLTNKSLNLNLYDPVDVQHGTT